MFRVIRLVEDSGGDREAGSEASSRKKSQHAESGERVGEARSECEKRPREESNREDVVSSNSLRQRPTYHGTEGKCKYVERQW